ncbi:hypothetical protein RR48_03470 [Papilio machaon]|uniref:Uncharacterized protein n=1 Tax=Papilio machaon TaxID=76193 RepID=A0A0N0PAR3_PAPMA|nr:hypothetical protein RR48_03470 [Papilio machaon]
MNADSLQATFLNDPVLTKLLSSVSSTDETASPFWTLKLDIIRALLQFGTSVLGMASSTFFSASSH